MQFVTSGSSEKLAKACYDQRQVHQKNQKRESVLLFRFGMFSRVSLGLFPTDERDVAECKR